MGKYWNGLCGVIGGLVVFIILIFTGWETGVKVEALRATITTLETKVAEQHDTIVACHRALIGEETDVLSMYNSVHEVEQIDIVVHYKTESGLPDKFILNREGEL